MHRGTLGLLLLLAACDNTTTNNAPDAQPPPTQQGDLGYATFTYNCGGSSDPQCNVDSDLAPVAASSQFPTLAAGSVFDLTAKVSASADAGAGTVLTVVPVSTSFLDKDMTGTMQTAKRPGVSTVLAEEGGNIVDLTSVVIGTPDHIKILQATPTGSFQSGSITIGPGGVTATSTAVFTFKFRAFVVDKNENLLAGAFACNWVSSDSTIANLTSDPKSNIATVVSGNKGTATVTVTLGTFTANVTITVS